MPVVRATRYHDISCGHRVVGHEGKCQLLHGHNYRVHFHCEADALDSLGRVIDFGVIKSSLCEWLEQNWDHHMLLWQEDPLLPALLGIDPSIVTVPFNPTAENIALHLLNVVGPQTLPEEVLLVRVVVDETRKCSCEAAI
jgi:6-pyruvoyltetrahydropterin/6-carboxytetrahydropterin synthase